MIARFDGWRGWLASAPPWRCGHPACRHLNRPWSGRCHVCRWFR